MTDTNESREAAPDLGAQALAHLQKLLSYADFEAVAEIELREGDTITLAVSGPDAAMLVGQHGQTLDALQYMMSLMTNKGRDQRLRLTIDADGYRARRTQTLVKFANNLAEQVIGSGQEAVTDSLNPLERRIVHTALANHPDVETYSEGDEPHRYVVVTPRQADSAA